LTNSVPRDRVPGEKSFTDSMESQKCGLQSGKSNIVRKVIAAHALPYQKVGTAYTNNMVMTQPVGLHTVCVARYVSSGKGRRTGQIEHTPASSAAFSRFISSWYSRSMASLGSCTTSGCATQAASISTKRNQLLIKQVGHFKDALCATLLVSNGGRSCTLQHK
jgi:hypothetical protein